MGSKLKGLQEWCQLQCKGYKDVSIVNMTTSWRDGLAFCAIIHRYHPELINFESLSKENVYENNKLAFDTASKLGISAFLDPEDMVSMQVPDRLSIITYVSQYYNVFRKQDSSMGQRTPIKRQANENLLEDDAKKQHTDVITTLESNKPSDVVCQLCKKKVFLMERFFDGKQLYHRDCFRKNERKDLSEAHSEAFNNYNDDGKCAEEKNIADKITAGLADKERNLKVSNVSDDVIENIKNLNEHLRQKSLKSRPAPPVPSLKVNPNVPEPVGNLSSKKSIDENVKINDQTTASIPVSHDAINGCQNNRSFENNHSGDHDNRSSSLSKASSHIQRSVSLMSKTNIEGKQHNNSPSEKLNILGKPSSSNSNNSFVNNSTVNNLDDISRQKQRDAIRNNFLGLTENAKDSNQQNEVTNVPVDHSKPYDKPTLPIKKEAEIIGTEANNNVRVSETPVAKHTDNKIPDKQNYVSNGNAESLKENNQPILRPPRPSIPKDFSRNSDAYSHQDKLSSCPVNPVPKPRRSTLLISDKDLKLLEIENVNNDMKPLPKPRTAKNVHALEIPIESAPQNDASSNHCETAVSKAKIAPRRPPPPNVVINTPTPTDTNKKTLGHSNSNNNVSPPDRPSAPPCLDGKKKIVPNVKFNFFDDVESESKENRTDEWLLKKQMAENMMKIDSKLLMLEVEGKELEKKIRNCDISMEDYHLERWFELISQRNNLLREEADLIYTYKQQELEISQANIEFKLRMYLAMPDCKKSNKDKCDEQMLLNRKLEAVNKRSNIIDKMEEDRLRYIKEDEEIESKKKKVPTATLR